MQDMQKHLEVFRHNAEECQRVSDRAIDHRSASYLPSWPSRSSGLSSNCPEGQRAERRRAYQPRRANPRARRSLPRDLAIGNLNAIGSRVPGLDSFYQRLPSRLLGNLARRVDVRKLLPFGGRQEQVASERVKMELWQVGLHLLSEIQAGKPRTVPADPHGSGPQLRWIVHLYT
jgi:hypothetical protein